MAEWLWIPIAVALVGGAYALTHIYWSVASRIRRRRAGTTPLRAVRHRIWHDPGPVETIDLAAGPGGSAGAPAQPFRFIEESASGSSPCAIAVDARGRRWRVKWGNEVRSEPFACRLAWAAGYFVETNYFVPRGRIETGDGQPHAAGRIGADGEFTDACFELDDPHTRKLFDEHGWAWNDNPFVGTRELNGLKIIVLLLSNWDNKDVRDVARGSNTAIFEHPLPGGGCEARYLIIDWGGSMGGWGATVLSRDKWDCEAYAAQSERFVVGVDSGVVRWGFTGQRTSDAAEGLTVEDVAWINRRLSRLSDAQLRAALEACGASAPEVACFTAAIRQRLNRLSALVLTDAA